MNKRRLAAVAAALALLLIPARAPAAEGSRPALPDFPIETTSLDNGLRVVLSVDHTFPVVGYSITYGVGSRAEVPGRTGFAHLFEHMMFEGSANVGKGEYFKYVESNGGVFNGQTHVDYTNYFAEMPAHRLELALWLEADRMRSLAITPENLANQKEAVKEEKRLSFDNQPYVNALAVDLYANAFSNQANSHSLIGSFEDLNAAKVEDVAGFFRTYYAPNNAVLTLVGDFDPAEARRLIEKHFSSIPRQPAAPAVDAKEPAPSGEKRFAVKDPHAPAPALVVAWRGPERGSAAYYALGILEKILYDGTSSRLYQGLVKGKEVAVSLDGGLGYPLGSAVDYRSPALFALNVIYKPVIDATALASLIDGEVARIAKEGVPAEELARAKVQFRSQAFRRLTGTLERAISLGVYASVDGDPKRLAADLGRFLDVSSDDVRQAAATYLTPRNRIVEEIQPAPPEGAPGAAGKED